MEKYYKIDADLSLLKALPTARQIAQVTHIIKNNQTYITQYLSCYTNKDTDELSAYLKRNYQYDMESSVYHTYLICSQSAKKIVGQISLVDDLLESATEVFYFMDKEASGKNIMTRVLSFLQQELLLNDKTDKLLAYIAKTNLPSLSVVKKCGFQTKNAFMDTLCCYQTKEHLTAFLAEQASLKTRLTEGASR